MAYKRLLGSLNVCIVEDPENGMVSIRQDLFLDGTRKDVKLLLYCLGEMELKNLRKVIESGINKFPKNKEPRIFDEKYLGEKSPRNN